MDRKLFSMLSRPLVSCNPKDTIAFAMEIMKEQAISSIVIVDQEDFPLGIFTEFDVLRIIADGVDVYSRIENEMTHNPICINESVNFNDAYSLMEEKQYRHLIVTDELGKALSVITQGDFLRHIGFEYLGDLKLVSEAMNQSPLVVRIGITLQEAAEMMKQRKYEYAIVLDENYPVGILTERDIIRHYDNVKNTSCLIDSIVRDDFKTILKTVTLEEAAKIMESHGVHQLIVVNEDGRFCGLLNRHDVLHSINSAYFDYLLRLIDQKNDTIFQINERAKSLEYQTAFLQTLISTIPSILWLKDTEGKYLSVNSIFSQIHDIKIDDLIGKKDEDLPLSDDFTALSRLDHEVIKSRSVHSSETVLRFADGSYEGVYHTIKTPMVNHMDEVIGVLGIAHDITERKKYENELKTIANYDLLTGLLNRASLLEYLERAIGLVKHTTKPAGLILLDLDNFKNINDSYGHNAGDELIQKVASRLVTHFKEEHVIARLGGDEFAIIVSDLNNPEDIGKRAGEIIDFLESGYSLSNGAFFHINTSAGIAIYPEHGEDAATLLQKADTALYKAKAEGRKRYCYYTDELTIMARKRIECETGLRRAIEKNEFEVYYQPQVHISTGRIIGAEALVRWNDPQRGLVSPNAFIPIAEETGLIRDIGEWVLNETCRQGKIWLDQGHRLLLAVNLSPHQIHNQDVMMLVDEALRKNHYPAERLELEFTESALMKHETDTVSLMHRLRALGIRLAIDDFGTGYSSLSYLKRFPIDVLKIDKSFVDDIPFDMDNMAIAEAIIAMGKALGFQVLAEGTERVEQIEFLASKGCTMYQGYYKSPPLPAKEFEKLLA